MPKVHKKCHIAKSPLIIQTFKPLGCIKENVKYQPTDDVLGAPRSLEISAEACQTRCASNSECAFFSFLAKDLPEDNGCTLFGPDAVFVEQKEVESSSEKAKMYREFRSHCFTSFGHYTGGELENEGRTTDEKNAKECQARCAATAGCSFFTFKEVGAGCHLSSSAAQPVRAKGVISGPLPCQKTGWFVINGSLMLSHQKTRLNFSQHPNNSFCQPSPRNQTSAMMRSWTQKGRNTQALPTPPSLEELARY